MLVSSHQLNEVQEIADRVVILNRGRLVRSGSIAELTAGTDRVLVRGPDLKPLWDALAGHAHLDQPEPGAIVVRGPTAAQVGTVAHKLNVELHELTPQRSDLEDLFFALTSEGQQP